MAKGDINFLSANNTDCTIEDGDGNLQRASVVAVANPVDTFLQDQYSGLVDKFLTRKFQEVTVSSDILFGARTVTLEPGHGFTNTPAFSEMLEIDIGTSQYQSRVLSVSVNTLTLTNPFCCDVPAGTVGNRTSPDANVNGSGTPIIFDTTPPLGVLWDINILAINMLDASPMDDSTFGGIAGPINGVVYRTVNDIKAENIFTAVDNSCFIRHCDTENPYSDKAPAGLYGFNSKRRFNGQQGDGVSRRIGEEYHKFECIVQADITGLNRFWNVIRGHVVI